MVPASSLYLCTSPPGGPVLFLSHSSQIWCPSAPDDLSGTLHDKQIQHTMKKRSKDHSLCWNCKNVCESFRNKAGGWSWYLKFGPFWSKCGVFVLMTFLARPIIVLIWVFKCFAFGCFRCSAAKPPVGGANRLQRWQEGLSKIAVYYIIFIPLCKIIIFCLMKKRSTYPFRYRSLHPAKNGHRQHYSSNSKLNVFFWALVSSLTP